MSANSEPTRKLRSIVREMGKVLIAYSGGVDSTYLLHFCLDNLGKDAVSAVVVDHPLLRDGEVAEAVELGRQMGIAVLTIELDPRCIEAVAANAADRCYHCKTFIFGALGEMADSRGIPWLLDGTNADDDHGYRPGIQALEELGVRSPLREAGLMKGAIRAQSRSAGLPTWDKPSAPCLATRFPYGHAISDDDLDRVKEGESVLREEGLEDLRLRVHGDVARIEVPERMLSRLAEDGLRQRLVAALKSLGYGYVTLDLEGLRSGSMDASVENDLITGEE